VLRLIIELSGELVNKIDIHIGFLHRSTEFLISTVSYLKALPYFDRLDYVSVMSQEHAFCLTLEKLLNMANVSSLVMIIRVLLDELTRVLNHLLAIACHALDIGSMSCIF
jgi:NADH:ubiquinone oxidoreductase subunit D